MPFSAWGTQVRIFFILGEDRITLKGTSHVKGSEFRQEDTEQQNTSVRIHCVRKVEIRAVNSL